MNTWRFFPRFGVGALLIAAMFVAIFLAPNTSVRPVMLAVAIVLAVLYLVHLERSKENRQLKASRFRRRGMAQFRRGNYQEAIRAFNKVVRTTPDDPVDYSWRGLAHQMVGNWNATAKDFEKALQLRPKDPILLLQLANLLAACPDAHIRDGTRAVALARQACQLSNWTDWRTLSALAAAFAEVGDFDRAIEYAEKAVRVAPPDVADGRKRILQDYRERRPLRLATEPTT